MASTTGCSHQLEDLGLSDTPGTTGDLSTNSDFAISTSAREAIHATASTSYFSTVEEQIEQSKAHWSMLVDHSGDTDEEEMDFAMSNEQEFKALQRHPKWGDFFANFTGDAKSTGFGYVYGELVMGKKFAEGGQAELYEVQVKLNNQKNVESDERVGREYVLKVFKEGTLLKDVKSQMPQGMLLFHAMSMENLVSPTPKTLPTPTIAVFRGVLLNDGRFAFVIEKMQLDLRTAIERNMILRSDEEYGPFSMEEAEIFMFIIALGVKWLHNYDIVHRDLKASNVLVTEIESGWPKWLCYLADYECSIGVVGTNFFRAPEILQVCKDRKVNERLEVFSKGADVYSYGMTCYEILTGRLPFEDHPLSDNPSLLIDLVINQDLRPEVPEYVEDWARELLVGCWQANPETRPEIGEILNVLIAKSASVRRWEVVMKNDFGLNFRG